MSLTVVTPSITAFGAPVELGHTLVNASGLNHPPLGLKVITFLAFNCGFWHNAELFLFLTHNDYLLVDLFLTRNC